MDNQVNQQSKICMKCGVPLAPNSAFCTACGNPVPQPVPQQPQPQGSFCSNCGKALAPNTAFCTMCGTPVAQKAAQQAQPVPPPVVPFVAPKQPQAAPTQPQAAPAQPQAAPAQPLEAPVAEENVLDPEAEKLKKAQAKKRMRNIIIAAVVAFVVVVISVAAIVVANMPFEVTYELDGGSVSVVLPNTHNMVSDEIVLPTPTKTGYTFTGWEGKGIDGSTIKKLALGKLHYTATWRPNEYSLTIDFNDGTTPSQQQIVVFDTEFLLPEPTRRGYTFGGWYNGSQMVEPGIWKKASDINLVAHWTPCVYDITFTDILEQTNVVVTYDYNYVGKSDYAVIVPNGETLSMPTTPTRSNYVFRGWFTDSACTKKYDFTGKITEDMTLYAGWQHMSMTNRYTQTAINPANYYSTSYAYGVSTYGTSSTSYYHIYLAANESGQHKIYYKNEYSGSSYSYRFQIYNLTKGEYIKNTSTVSSTSYNYVTFNCSAGDVIVISLYKYSSYSSKAYFYFTGFDTVVSDARAEVSGYKYSYSDFLDDKVTFGEEFTLPTPVRPGYKFMGWYYNGTLIEDGTWDFDHSVTLTPSWEKYGNITLNNAAEGSNTITVTYNYNYSGSTPYVVTLNDNETLTYHVPTRVGYIFEGWYTNSSCTQKYTFTGTISSDITLYARWTNGSFYATNDYSYPWLIGDGTLTSANQSNSSSSTYTITASSPITVSFNYYTASEQGYDYLYIRVNGYTERSCSGNTTLRHFSVTLYSGDTLTLTYSKDSSGSYYNDRAYITDFSITGASLDTSSSAKAQTVGEGKLVYSEYTNYVIENVASGDNVVLPTIVRQGYTFLGWYYDNKKVESGTWPYSGDVTLTPRWRAN